MDKNEMLDNEIKNFIRLWFNDDKAAFIRYLKV